ncbi:transporter [Chryseobacterium sp. MMS23-Vi53]|uniref:transporter n=1 Tax=Chryseobacterium sp. MMS23-Vi53 TaxID=3386644 RepID=UPI0039ECB81C
MNHKNYILNFALAAFFIPFNFKGQQKQDKKFSIFNPVPKTMMREMETDRPDVTESPYTVDAGHFQYETDIVRNIRETSESTNTSTLLINQGNLKIGLTGSTAIQINFQTYGRQKETDLSTGKKTISEGIGDVSFRVKQNIIGNDHGNFALAILPYVKFPTSKYDDESMWEGGLIVPMQYKLPGEWNLGFQVEVDRLKDKDQHALHTELLQTLTLSHSLVKNLDAIAETYYTYDFKAHQFSNYINAALQMEVIKDLKLDAGVNYGLQHSAEKHYFVGASYRY